MFSLLFPRPMARAFSGKTWCKAGILCHILRFTLKIFSLPTSQRTKRLLERIYAFSTKGCYYRGSVPSDKVLTIVAVKCSCEVQRPSWVFQEARLGNHLPNRLSGDEDAYVMYWQNRRICLLQHTFLGGF